MSREPKELIRLYDDQKTATALRDAGLDMDFEDWSFQFVLRNDLKATLPISGRDYRHLLRRVQSADRHNFLVFDSGPNRYAINGDHLVFCQFLFDFPCQQKEETDVLKAKVYLSTREEPFIFDLAPAMGDDDQNQWQSVFNHLDGLFGLLEDTEVDRISFEDDDSERAFFRTDDVALLQVSLTAVDERMARVWLEESDEPAPSTKNQDTA
jgi:hypothetical protein